jgi:hypothetical protein
VTCNDTTLALGAYVLGALDESERQQVDAHVQECPECARELAGLQPLPPLLHRVRLEDVEIAPVAPSPDLFERVAAAAAAESRSARGSASARESALAREAAADAVGRAAPSAHRTRRWLLAAAAVVVLGGGLGGAAWVAGSPEPSHSAVTGSVHMTVTADADPAGTTLDVTVAGVSAGENCRLVVVDSKGNRHQAGAWTASYAGTASFRGWTAVDRSDVTDVVLLGTNGQQLVRVPL